MQPPRKPNIIMQFFRFQVPLWVILPFLVLAVMFGLGSGFVGARQLTPATECPEAPEVCAEFSAFWQVWDLASRNFIDPDVINSQAMINGAINGMLDSLGDQGHTRYLSAEDAERWNESIQAEFEGIGAYIDVRDGQTIIVAPIEGSPAEAAGIEAGDIILAVDGESTEGWNVEELVTNVRGPRGTTVVLTVLHEGEATPVDIEVTRGRINVPSVSWVMLPDDIAYVKLNSFSRRATEEMTDALTEAQDQGAQGLILDLRDNPGGLVDEALGIASQFVPRGTTLFLEADRDGNQVPSRTNSEGVAQDIPMVILINANSASSSEIVSGALQVEGRATLVGIPTVGTGTVLSSFTLDNGGRLLLGTSQWLTPDGRLIRNQGITPDVEVILEPESQQLTPNAVRELSDEEFDEANDGQLLEAIDLLSSPAAQQ